MNRKTNIFYNENREDSKFLTFNNYTEALTGDILAIDYKLWPSRFICAYIDELDKEDFILKLQKYYENKLATLRDNIDDHSLLKPLNYLITFMYWYAFNYNKDAEASLSPKEIEIGLYEQNNDILNSVQFNYISDIVEQQYNGTYSDIICTINPNKWYRPNLNFVDLESYNEDASFITVENTEYLHGWENEIQDTITKLGENITEPIFDDKIVIENESEANCYYLKSIIENLNITEVNTFENQNLKFNIVIPLFNVINTENANDIENDEVDVTTITLNNKSNIPLGIYFADSEINLSIDGKFSTNWSLLISTQFSAFPFSYDIQQNFDDSQYVKQAYVTFAEILANQTNFTDAITKYENYIKSLQKKIILLENKVNNLSTVQTIDNLSQNVVNITNSQNNYVQDIYKKLEKLERKIEANKIKWNVQQKN